MLSLTDDLTGLYNRRGFLAMFRATDAGREPRPESP